MPFGQHSVDSGRTEILRQSLVVARAHGVDAVLLICAIDNAGF